MALYLFPPEENHVKHVGGLRFSLVLRLAWRDLAAEALLAVCSTVGISATLAPLVVLAGLHAGVMQGLQQALLEDPHARELVTVANRSFTAASLASIAARPDVSFMMPKTRTLAASILIEPPGQADAARRIELIPTMVGDPLLGAAAALDDDQVILSASAAASLHVAAGAKLQARVARLVTGRQDVVVIPVIVRSVAVPAVTSHDAAFTTLQFSLAVQTFQEGSAAWNNRHIIEPDNGDRVYAGFRLYARELSQVPALDQALRGIGIDIASHAGDVAGLLSLDRRLSILFVLVASLGATGFLVSLGAGLWANVKRKHRSLALLRFVGLSTSGLLLFPVAQSAILAICGGLLGIAAAVGVSLIINSVFAGTLPLGQPLCTVTPTLGVLSALITLAGACAAALVAGRRATRIQAWDGVTGE